MEAKKLRLIVGELQDYAREVKEEEIEAATELIAKSERIFLAGAGRSGFVARAFANRLLHLGFAVYFVGESTVPPIRTGDLLTIISGSGTTGSLVIAAKKAKNVGAKILTLTIAPTHTIGQAADCVIVIPGNTRKIGADANEKKGSVQPIGSMFEQLSLLVCDSMILTLMEKLGQTREDLLARHANLE